jgi:hypothetical protein
MKNFLKIYIIIFVSLICCNKCKKTIDLEEPKYDERNISRNKETTFGGGITIDKVGNVHIVWWDSLSNGKFQIVYKSKKNGIWQPTEVVWVREGRVGLVRIAVDLQGKPHIVWEELEGERIHIYYSYKENGFWSFPQKISGDYPWNELPQIGIDGQGRVHVIYMRRGIGYTRKEGNTWLPPIEISPFVGGQNPAMYVEPSGEIHGVYEYDVESATPDIMYVHSPDGGITWEERVNISQSHGLYSYFPDVYANNGKVYVTWSEMSDGVWIGIKDENGDWIKERVEDATGRRYGISYIKVENEKIYVVYHYRLSSENVDVFYTKKDGIWKGGVNISNTPFYSGSEGFEVLNKKIYILWVEIFSMDDMDVYYDEIETF